jgi:hypothetical protein
MELLNNVNSKVYQNYQNLLEEVRLQIISKKKEIEALEKYKEKLEKLIKNN